MGVAPIWEDKNSNKGPASFQISLQLRSELKRGGTSKSLMKIWWFTSMRMRKQFHLQETRTASSIRLNLNHMKRIRIPSESSSSLNSSICTCRKCSQWCHRQGRLMVSSCQLLDVCLGVPISISITLTMTIVRTIWMLLIRGQESLLSTIGSLLTTIWSNRRKKVLFARA